MTIGVGREGESLGSEYQEVQQGNSRAMTWAPQAFSVIIKFLVFVDVSFKTLILAAGYFEVFRSGFIVFKLFRLLSQASKLAWTVAWTNISKLLVDG